MYKVLLTKAGNGWMQVEVESDQVVPMIMQGYSIVRHSARLVRQ